MIIICTPNLFGCNCGHFFFSKVLSLWHISWSNLKNFHFSHNLIIFILWRQLNTHFNKLHALLRSCFKFSFNHFQNYRRMQHRHQIYGVFCASNMHNIKITLYILPFQLISGVNNYNLYILLLIYIIKEGFQLFYIICRREMLIVVGCKSGHNRLVLFWCLCCIL